MKVSWAGVVAMSLLGASMMLAQSAPGVAAAPPMGWNSWDAYGLTITEEQVSGMNRNGASQRACGFGVELRGDR